MERVVRELRYLGRLIAGRLREWWRLLVAGREVSALRKRRDELLFRLGARYHQFLTETGTEPLPAVTETTLDLRAVHQRMADLAEMKRRIRDETTCYLEALLEPAVPPLRAGPRRPPHPSPVVPAPRARPATSPQLLEEMPARRGAPDDTEEEKCECGEAFPPGANFCPLCGRPRGAQQEAVSPDIAPPRRCPNCGAEAAFGAEFCPGCGGHMDAEVYEM
ncbi:MAG TPA: zinc ribbon domain-containing protein [Armatimonadota bacterium]|nr:zinc ribbon domain-containing protein [Armatimonadota bacterium]